MLSLVRSHLEIYLVPVEGLTQDLWTALSPMVENALATSDTEAMKYNSDDILYSLQQEGRQLWVIASDLEEGIDIRAMIITEIIDYPRQRVCNIFLVSGVEMNKWLEKAQSKIDGWAKANKCETIEAYGRSGWHRVADGYQKVSTVIRKVL